MRRILVGLLVLAFVVIGAAFIIPALIPPESLRTSVQTQASTTLGRPVALNGQIGLSILPRLEITASDAEITNAEGFGDEPFAEMREMRFSLALGPLLTRRIEIEEFILVDPVIRLEQRGSANNWGLGSNTQSAEITSSADSIEFLRQSGALPFDASFGDVRIENGSISYREGAIVRSIDELNLTVVLPSMDDPVSFDGSMNLDGFPTRFDAELQSLRGFFEGQRTDIAFNITGALADIAFSGHFLESEDVSLDGGIDLTLAVRALSRYLGTDLPEGDTFRHFKADSDIAIRPGQVSLSNGVIEFDDTVANEGTLVLDYDRVRPLVTGNLNVEQLDLTPYLPASAQSVETEGDATIPPWSEEEMDLSPLRAIDADLSFTAAAFRARDIEAENVDITARLENGRLVSTLSDFGLYSGIGNLVAVVNARNARPSYSLRAIMDGLDALPFLGAAAQFDLLKGLGSVNLDLTASGASQAAIMNSLSGTGSFDFSEGAIVGVNLAQVMRTIQQAVTTGSLPSGFATEEETDFSSLTGTLQISNGVADNLDLSMLSPLLRVAGTGRVNLAEQSLDYLLTPRAVTALTGQGGELDLNGLEIPIRLVGDFNNVGIEIDYGAVAQSLLRAEAGDLIVGDLGDALGRGQSLEDAAGDALRNFLGGSDDEEDEEADPAQQLLRGLLGSGRDNDDDDEDDSDNR